jgi:hypothetical protein
MAHLGNDSAQTKSESSRERVTVRVWLRKNFRLARLWLAAAPPEDRLIRVNVNADESDIKRQLTKN